MSENALSLLSAVLSRESIIPTTILVVCIASLLSLQLTATTLEKKGETLLIQHQRPAWLRNCLDFLPACEAVILFSALAVRDAGVWQKLGNWTWGIAVAGHITYWVIAGIGVAITLYQRRLYKTGKWAGHELANTVGVSALLPGTLTLIFLLNR